MRNLKINSNRSFQCSANRTMLASVAVMDVLRPKVADTKAMAMKISLTQNMRYT